MQYLISQEKKYPANSPHIYIYIYILFKEKKTNKTCNMEMTSYAKARSNLWMLDDANTEKQSLDLFFLSSPNNTCKVLSRDIGGKHNWFLDCI
jgi:N-acetyl-gamma-glutamylphosphate reductase